MRYLSTGQAAKILGVSRMTVNRWVRSGRFPNTRRTSNGRAGKHRIPEPDVLAISATQTIRYAPPSRATADADHELHHRALAAAIILQAFKDAPKDPAVTPWLASPLALFILDALDLPPENIPRAMLKYQQLKTRKATSHGPHRPARGAAGIT